MPDFWCRSDGGELFAPRDHPKDVPKKDAPQKCRDAQRVAPATPWGVSRIGDDGPTPRTTRRTKNRPRGSTGKAASTPSKPGIEIPGYRRCPLRGQNRIPKDAERRTRRDAPSPSTI